MGPNFFLVGISWVKNIFLWVYCGFQIFSCGYFHWVQNFFLWLFRGSPIFSRGYFVDTKYFLVAICGSQFFSCGYFLYSICSIKTMVKNKDIYLKLSVKMPQYYVSFCFLFKFIESHKILNPRNTNEKKFLTDKILMRKKISTQETLTTKKNSDP